MGDKPYKKIFEMLEFDESDPKKSNIVWFLVMVLLTFVILSVNFMPGRVNLAEGDIAEDNVYYFGASTNFVHKGYTKQAQDLAASKVEQIYKYDDTVLKGAYDRVDALFADMDGALASGTTAEMSEQLLDEVLNGAVSDGALTYYEGTGDEQKTKITGTLKQCIERSYSGRQIPAEEVEALVEDCRWEINGAGFNDKATEIMLASIDIIGLEPTYVFDQVATVAAVENAISQIAPVTISVDPGQVIVAQDAVVTADQVETLEALGLQKSGSVLQSYVGLLLFVAICYILILVFINNMTGAVKHNKNSINVIGVLFLMILLIAKTLTMISFNTDITSDLMMGLAIPVPAFIMLITALINRRTAIFSTIILSMFIGIICGANMLYIFAATVGGLVGVVQVSNMGSRSRYALATVYISLAYIAVVLAWSCMWNYSVEVVLTGVLMAVINGLASIILAVGILPLMESAFKITTEIRLLELSNLNHPLLKKLMVEAPGTYNHSILVGNLAEAAADQVGANGLLVRVASYFHDIGKSKRPYFFVENQKPGENAHDKLQPSLSTFIITSHAKEGREMALEYKLPEEILDIIEQHHGTGVLKGFYFKAMEAAKENGTEDQIREEDFRYPGPIPQTTEAAIVMLADSCQAAIQSMKGATAGQIEGKVREIIKAKVDEGQLANCTMTFRDLDVVGSTFAKILAGVNHYRIPYPDQIAKEMAAKKDKETKALEVAKDSEKDGENTQKSDSKKADNEKSSDKVEKTDKKVDEKKNTKETKETKETKDTKEVKSKKEDK